MRNVVNFDRNWKFKKIENQKAQDEEWEEINLPHTWNALDGQDGGNDYFRGIGTYLKMFPKKILPPADHYFLEISGANSVADVFLNGKKLGHHEGGYSTFRVEMTGFMCKENRLEIAVDNSAHPGVYPKHADFTFYGGLYRSVKIVCVSKTHFALEMNGENGIWITSKLDEKREEALITIRTYVVDLQGAGGGMVEIFDHTGTVVGKAALGPSECADGEREVQITEIPLQNVHLWNGTKDPYLYKVRARLLAKDGEILDEVTTSMGVRDFFLDPQKGFFLNGVSYPLHGVSRHQDRKGIGNALLPCHHLEDMEMICEMGANTIRLAHYQQDQYFLDLCDQKGMIVWAEIPFISEFLEEGVQNTMDQMRELVTQNYNHPSIVVWGISNEITMMSHQKENITQNHVKLKQLIRELDPQRPVSVAVIASCDPDHPYLKVPDILSFNLYLGWYSGNVEDSGPWLDAVHRKFPEIPIGLSEYGCEAAGWHSSTPEAGDYSEEYQAFYHEKMIEQLWNRPYLWATHVWNMFDFGSDAKDEGGEAGQNHKGLVTFDRLYKKDAFYAYKAWLSDEPFVHICGKNYVDHTEDVVVVRVYSNQPEVELYVNGSSVGTQYAENHFFSFEVSNIGCSELTAKAGKCVDTRILRKVNTPNEKYVLNDEGMVLNWYEITDIPGYYSIKDTIGNIYENPEAREIFRKFENQIFDHMNQVSTEKRSAEEMRDQGRNMGEKNISNILNEMKVTRFVNVIKGRFQNENLITKRDLIELNSKLNKIKKQI